MKSLGAAWPSGQLVRLFIRQALVRVVLWLRLKIANWLSPASWGFLSSHVVYLNYLFLNIRVDCL